MRITRNGMAVLGLLALALCGCVPLRPAHAQFIGFTSPQTVQNTLATATVCNGSAQTLTVANLGQNQHYAFVTFSVGTATAAKSLSMNFVGIDTAGNQITISDQVNISGNGSTGALYAAGYYPIVRLSIVCTGNATFSVTYSGTSASFPTATGTYAITQQDKFLVSGLASSGSPQTFVTQTPYGDMGGIVEVQTGAGLAGVTLSVACLTSQNNVTGVLPQAYTVANSTAAQFFYVAPQKCPLAQVTFSGPNSATTFSMEYLFNQPGASNTQISNYSHITGTTATAVKATTGTVTTVTIGTPAAGTVTLTDLPTASCTMTPSTNVVSVLTAVAATSPLTLPLDLFFQNGICVKASVAMDLTIGFQ